jgi:hypothetical protein
MAVYLFAADVTSSITVSFFSNKDYNVQIDGRSYYADNNSIMLRDIRPGRHTIEVYSIKRNYRKSSRPIYSSTFTVRPQYDMDIIIDAAGRIRFDERRADYRGNNRNDHDWNSNDRSWNNKGGNDRRYNDRDYDERDRRYDNSGYGTNDGYNKAMSAYDFSQLVQKIRGQWFGNAKYNTAKDAVTTNYLATSQVYQLVQLFSSENEKLELAKSAYRNTVDQRNFSQLYELFSYNGQMQLDRFIKDYRY